MKFADLNSIETIGIELSKNYLDKVLDHFYETNYWDLPIVDNNKLIGILNLQDCLKNKSRGGLWTNNIKENIIWADMMDDVENYIDVDQTIIPVKNDHQFAGFIETKLIKELVNTALAINEKYEQKLQYYKDLEERYKLAVNTQENFTENTSSFHDMMNRYEKKILLAAKDKTKSTKEMSEKLQIDPSTIRRKFNKHKISFDF